MKQAEFEVVFKGILKEMENLCLAKNHDYSGTDSPLANLMACEQAGIAGWKGIVGVRMQDKMSRILNFAKKETLKVQDEKVEDTLRDLSVYCILAIIAYREYKKNGLPNQAV